jgi:hypothetical protein
MAKKVRKYSTEDPGKSRIRNYFNTRTGIWQDAPEKDVTGMVNWEQYTPSAELPTFEYVEKRMTDKDQQDYTNRVNNAQVFGQQYEKQIPRKNQETYEENNALIKDWNKKYWNQQLLDKEAALAAKEKERQRLMQEFVDQQNSNKSALQSSFGNLSLDNPATRDAARNYAEYKLGESSPKNWLDETITGTKEVGTYDFYRPNNSSKAFAGSMLPAAAIAAPAVGAGVSAAAPFLAPLAGPLLNPITGEALAGGTLTFQNALNAYFVANGIKSIPETYKAWEKAFTSEGKGYEDVKNAATQTLVNALDFIGAGEGKEGAKMIAKDISKGYQYAKSFANKGYEAASKAAVKIGQKIDDAPIVQAWRFDDKEGGRIAKEIQEHNDEYDNLNHVIQAGYDDERELEILIDRKKDDLRRKRLGTPDRYPEAANYRINRDRTEAIQKASSLRKEGDALVAAEGSNFNSITTTGENTIIDFKTGKPVQAKVDPIGGKVIYKKEPVDPKILEMYPGREEQLALKREGLDRKITKDFEISEANVNPEYKETLRSNIQHIEETIPGTKIFGSSVGVSEGGLPHLTGDYDALITESAYNANVNGKYANLGPKGPAQAHDLGIGGEQGHIDFNIIHENPDGTVRVVWQQMPGGDVRSLEVELFRQFDPKGFYEASKEAIRTGQEIKIPYKAQELMDKVDPVAKTIMDAYESTKSKHMNRIDSYINFGNPEAIAKAQQQYVNSVVGEGSIGPQFSTEALSNVAENETILNLIGFIGESKVVARSPERMQIALNDFYINNSIYSRQISQSTDIATIESALKNWDPSKGGGSANGWGLNTVRKGDPAHKMGDRDILGHRQLGLKVSDSSPMEMVNNVKRQTDGNYIFTPEEQNEIYKIIESIAGKDMADQSRLSTNSDLLRLPTADTRNTQKIYNEISKKLGIRAASNGNLYLGGSAYYSMLGDFDAAVDKLAYTMNGITTSLKSFDQRAGAFSRNSVKAPDIKSVKEFELLENYINGGIVKAKARVQEFNKTIENINSQIAKLQEAYTKKEKEQLAEILEQQKALMAESRKAVDKYWELEHRRKRLATIRKESGLFAAATATVGGIGGYLMMQPDIEKNLENLRDNFGTGQMSEEEEEKLFEQKRSGGFNYTKNMLNANSVGGPRSKQSWQDPGVNEFSGNTNGVKAAYYLKKGGLKQKVASKFSKLKK